MALILGIWAFASFVGYRIATQALFSEPLSILACLLCSALTCGTIFIVTGFYSLKGLQSEARIRMRQNNDGWLGTLFTPFVLACIGNVMFCFGIAYGFSERFYSIVTRTSYSREFWDEGWFTLCIIFIVPIFVHFVMTVVSVRAQNKMASRPYDDT